MEYFAKIFFQTSLDIYFQRSLDLHDPAHRTIFEVMVETDADPTLDPSTREWMLLPRARHVSSKFCRNLEYVQHLLETGKDDKLRLLFFKSVNVNNLFQRAKFKPTNHSKPHKIHDADCQTDGADGPCRTQTHTVETASQTAFCQKENACQTEIFTKEIGNQTATSTGDFAVQTEVRGKEIASQTEVCIKDTSIQTAISTGEFSTQTEIAVQETSNQTENFIEEAASQTENGGIGSTMRTYTHEPVMEELRMGSDDMQLEFLDKHKGDQSTADNRSKERKILNRTDNEYESNISERLLYGECDIGGGGDKTKGQKEDTSNVLANTTQYLEGCRLSYQLKCSSFMRLSLGSGQSDSFRYVEMPRLGKLFSVGRLTGSGSLPLSSDEEALQYNPCPNQDDNQQTLLNVLPITTTTQASCVQSTTPESSGRCIEQTSALDVDLTTTNTKQNDNLSGGVSGAVSTLPFESTESISAEVLSLEDCGRGPLSDAVASLQSSKSCTSPMSCTSYPESPQVPAPTSVLPVVPEIPAEQLAVKYTLGKSKIVLGVGTYGTVYLASHVPTGTTIVCKEQDLATSSYEKILREATIQLYLHATERVPYIYGISKTFGERGTACIFQQYYPNCPTVEELLKLPVGHVTKKEWVQLGYDVCAGLAKIHKMGVLHNDIKANNLIVVTETPPYRVKFIDFGLATDMNGMRYTSNPADAHKYPHLAPETFYNVSTTVQSDLYSTGYVLKLINEIVQSPLLKTITDRCSSKDPFDRPPVGHIMSTLDYIITSIFVI